MLISVLIVDDQKNIYAGIDTFLKKSARVVFATTHSEATDMIESESFRFNFIIFDGCLESGKYDTEPLIKLANKHQRDATLIAASSYPDVRQQMLKDGCSSQLEKGEVVFYLKDQMKQPVAA